MSSENDPVEQKRKGKGCLRWVGWAALGVFVFLLVSMAAGAIYQAAASSNDAKTYQPLDQMVDVDGVQMRLDCRGSGSPTVVLESGASMFSIAWARVQDDVSEFTRVCSYDRAGMGWSDSVGDELFPQHVSVMLHDLLKKAGEKPPYILVGHSLGGIYVRAYAQLYTPEVAGMVLVDSSHDNQNQLFPPEIQKLNAMSDYAFKFCQWTAPFGLVRAIKMMDSLASSTPITDEEKAPMLAAMYRTPYCGASAREMSMFNDYASRPKLLQSLEDIPLIVLSSGADAQEKYDEYPPALQSQVSLEVMQQMVDAWDAMQDDLAGLSTRGKRIIVQSGHNIQLDSPQTVVDAIREVFEQADQ